MTAAQMRPPRSAFGEVLTAALKGRVQLDATYGLRTSDWLVTQDANATATSANTGGGFEFIVSSGTNAAGFARLRSRRVVRYRTGEGSLFRFTGRFGTPQSKSEQRVGAGNIGCEFSFGYAGTAFGIFYITGGIVEIRTLTLSAGAGGNENVTVTLNGNPQVVAVTAGTAAAVAAQIATATFAGWEAYQNGATVAFIGTATGPRTGTYSFASTGTTAGTFARTRAGVTETKTHIPQSQWNIDPMNGRGPSGILLDPSKGNVFEVQQQYLGYGAIAFAVENPGHGGFQLVHRIEYANANTTPNIISPYMRLLMVALNSGASTGVSAYSASMAGFIEGAQVPLRDQRAYGATKLAVGTAFTNIVSFRCSRIFADRVNRAPTWPHALSFACDSTKPVECIAVINPAVATGTRNWTWIESTDSTTEFDTGATTISGGRIVAQFVVGKEGAVRAPVYPDAIAIEPGEVITLAARATQNGVTADVSASMSWEEE